MNLLIFLGLALLALALIFTIVFKKTVVDRQIEKKTKGTVFKVEKRIKEAV